MLCSSKQPWKERQACSLHLTTGWTRRCMQFAALLPACMGKDALQYLVKAVLLAAFLTLAGSCALLVYPVCLPFDVSYICPCCYYGRSVLRDDQTRSQAGYVFRRWRAFEIQQEMADLVRRPFRALAVFGVFLHLGRSSLGWSYLGPDLGGRSSVLSGISHR